MAGRSWIWPLLAIVCAACMWTYFYRVLIAHQDREARGTPRGNLSDLYPRWLGARELLLHGQDPYSPEFTREIQAGYYGRPLDPDGPGNRNYQQGFYYPAYVAFFLAPTIHLPFARVRKGFFWVVLSLTVTTIPLWLRALHWPVPLYTLATLIVFAFGSLAFVQGLLLQQITIFVVPVMAVAIALLVSDRPIPAGMLLAFSTIKPQLVCWLLLWLTIWTLADWRRRYRWALSFFLTMAILCAAPEWYLPHWIPRFYQALREYRLYTGEMSVLDELIGPPWSRMLEVAAVVVLIGVCWRERLHAANTSAFAFVLSLVLAVTILVTPTYGPYNQILLIPALLIMLKNRGTLWQKGIVNRSLAVITIGLVCWPWISSIVLAALSFVLPLETVERAWAVPFWTALQTPLAVCALMLVHYYQAYYQKTVTAPASLQSS
jgi:Glycosyltransferase family 87